MGDSRVCRAAGWAAALIAVASHADAANLFMLDDGFDGMDGHLEIPVDDYGSYGRFFPNSVFDWFQPAGDTPDFPTYMAGVFLFVSANGQTSSINFSEYDLWSALFEQPPNEDGLVGTHANLARTITTPITGSGNTATSAFEITSDDFAIHVDLTQTITTSTATATSLLAQVYTLRNDGTDAVDLVFHAVWDPDLYYSSGANNNFVNDVVGIVPGLCAVYVHNPNTTTQAIAFSSGPGTTVGTPTYFAGKEDELPPSGGSTPFAAYSAPDAEQYVWLAQGMPANWRNFVSGAGYSAVGDSNGEPDADASIGLEWRIALAAGASQTVELRRHYGTIAVPCSVPPSCGNGIVDTGECGDGSDTPTCNGGTCLTSACGDGYWNVMAGEECETGLVDSDSCNGMRCTVPMCGDGYVNTAANEVCDDGEQTAACTAMCQPSSCGDGYVNAAADEECEGGALCDPATCTATFTVGGGCAGCGSSTGATPWFAAFALAFSLPWARRRRRARTE